MPVYLCEVIGAGTEDNPFRPAIADYPVRWSLLADGRADQTKTAGTMRVRAETTPEQHAEIVADPRISLAE